MTVKIWRSLLKLGGPSPQSHAQFLKLLKRGQIKVTLASVLPINPANGLPNDSGDKDNQLKALSVIDWLFLIDHNLGDA